MVRHYTLKPKASICQYLLKHSLSELSGLVDLYTIHVATRPDNSLTECFQWVWTQESLREYKYNVIYNGQS